MKVTIQINDTEVIEQHIEGTFIKSGDDRLFKYDGASQLNVEDLEPGDCFLTPEIDEWHEGFDEEYNKEVPFMILDHPHEDYINCVQFGSGEVIELERKMPVEKLVEFYFDLRKD